MTRGGSFWMERQVGRWLAEANRQWAVGDIAYEKKPMTQETRTTTGVAAILTGIQLKITPAIKKRALRPSSSDKDATNRAAIEKKRGNLNYALVRACAAGDCLLVSALLRAGADPNPTPCSAECALEKAVSLRRQDTLKVLLEAGADPNRFTGPTPLILLAAYSSDYPMIRLLAKHGADLNATSRMKTSALHYGVKEKEAKLVNLLLDLGADPNVRDLDGRTPLSWAERLKQAAIANSLRKRGAKTQGKEAVSDLVLRAAAEGDLAQLKKLLQKKKDIAVDTRDTIDQRRFTPLMHAVANGHLACAEFLIARGADVEAIALPDDSVLTIAAEFGKTDAIKLLLKAGAKIERRNRELQTPLLRSAICRQTGAMKALLEAGADIAAHNPVDGTALNLSAAQKNLPGCRLLLDAGADVDFGGTDHNAPIFDALFDRKIVELFIHFGANLAITDHQQLTPLDICRKSPLGKECAATILESLKPNESAPRPNLAAAPSVSGKKTPSKKSGRSRPTCSRRQPKPPTR